jgi:hypothetical protein
MTGGLQALARRVRQWLLLLGNNSGFAFCVRLNGNDKLASREQFSAFEYSVTKDIGSGLLRSIKP